MVRARSVFVFMMAFAALLGGCIPFEEDDGSSGGYEGLAEEGPWTGPVTGPIGGPCADDAYDPGDVFSFTIVETTADGFDLTTGDYSAWCALDGSSFTCDPVQVQVSGDVADATILRTFVISGELSTADDMSGDVAFESACTGAGCTTTGACALTWSFSAQESS